MITEGGRTGTSGTSSTGTLGSSAGSGWSTTAPSSSNNTIYYYNASVLSSEAQADQTKATTTPTTAAVWSTTAPTTPTSSIYKPTTYAVPTTTSSTILANAPITGATPGSYFTTSQSMTSNPATWSTTGVSRPSIMDPGYVPSSSAPHGSFLNNVMNAVMPVASASSGTVSSGGWTPAIAASQGANSITGQGTWYGGKEYFKTYTGFWLDSEMHGVTDPSMISILNNGGVATNPVGGTWSQSGPTTQPSIRNTPTSQPSIIRTGSSPAISGASTSGSDIITFGTWSTSGSNSPSLTATDRSALANLATLRVNADNYNLNSGLGTVNVTNPNTGKSQQAEMVGPGTVYRYGFVDERNPGMISVYPATLAGGGHDVVKSGSYDSSTGTETLQSFYGGRSLAWLQGAYGAKAGQDAYNYELSHEPGTMGLLGDQRSNIVFSSADISAVNAIASGAKANPNAVAFTLWQNGAPTMTGMTNNPLVSTSRPLQTSQQQASFSNLLTGFMGISSLSLLGPIMSTTTGKSYSPPSISLGGIGTGLYSFGAGIVGGLAADLGGIWSSLSTPSNQSPSGYSTGGYHIPTLADYKSKDAGFSVLGVPLTENAKNQSISQYGGGITNSLQGEKNFWTVRNTVYDFFNPPTVTLRDGTVVNRVDINNNGPTYTSLNKSQQNEAITANARQAAMNFLPAGGDLIVIRGAKVGPGIISRFIASKPALQAAVDTVTPVTRYFGQVWSDTKSLTGEGVSMISGSMRDDAMSVFGNVWDTRAATGSYNPMGSYAAKSAGYTEPAYNGKSVFGAWFNPDISINVPASFGMGSNNVGEAFANTYISSSPVGRILIDDGSGAATKAASKAVTKATTVDDQPLLRIVNPDRDIEATAVSNSKVSISQDWGKDALRNIQLTKDITVDAPLYGTKDEGTIIMSRGQYEAVKEKAQQGILDYFRGTEQTGPIDMSYENFPVHIFGNAPVPGTLDIAPFVGQEDARLIGIEDNLQKEPIESATSALERLSARSHIMRIDVTDADIQSVEDVPGIGGNRGTGSPKPNGLYNPELKPQEVEPLFTPLEHVGAEGSERLMAPHNFDAYDFPIKESEAMKAFMGFMPESEMRGGSTLAERKYMYPIGQRSPMKAFDIDKIRAENTFSLEFKPATLKTASKIGVDVNRMLTGVGVSTMANQIRYGTKIKAGLKAGTSSDTETGTGNIWKVWAQQGADIRAGIGAIFGTTAAAAQGQQQGQRQGQRQSQSQESQESWYGYIRTQLQGTDEDTTDDTYVGLGFLTGTVAITTPIIKPPVTNIPIPQPTDTTPPGGGGGGGGNTPPPVLPFIPWMPGGGGSPNALTSHSYEEQSWRNLWYKPFWFGDSTPNSVVTSGSRKVQVAGNDVLESFGFRKVGRGYQTHNMSEIGKQLIKNSGGTDLQLKKIGTTSDGYSIVQYNDSAARNLGHDSETGDNAMADTWLRPYAKKFGGRALFIAQNVKDKREIVEHEHDEDVGMRKRHWPYDKAHANANVAENALLRGDMRTLHEARKKAGGDQDYTINLRNAQRRTAALRGIEGIQAQQAPQRSQRLRKQRPSQQAQSLIPLPRQQFDDVESVITINRRRVAGKANRQPLIGSGGIHPGYSGLDGYNPFAMQQQNRPSKSKKSKRQDDCVNLLGRFGVRPDADVKFDNTPKGRDIDLGFRLPKQSKPSKKASKKQQRRWGCI